VIKLKAVSLLYPPTFHHSDLVLWIHQTVIMLTMHCTPAQVKISLVLVTLLFVEH